MTPAAHLSALHAETVKVVSGFANMKIDPSNPLELDRLALVARTAAAASEAFAERADALATLLLEQA